MISTKYVCMLEGCDFISGDLAEAHGHLNEGKGHYVVEVSSQGEDVYCLKSLENSQERDYDE